MSKTPRQYATLLAAVVLLNVPGCLLPLLFPGFFHQQALRLLAAVVLSFGFTLPVLLKAWRYFHEDMRRSG
jgi:glycopeptide antibiotics resistance protein